MTDGDAMSDIVERAKAALEGVTEGPWVQVETAAGGEWWVELPHRATICESHGGRDVNPYDAEFLAASRQLVPELVAEVERLRAENERLRNTVVDAATCQHREALKGMPDD